MSVTDTYSRIDQTARDKEQKLRKTLKQGFRQFLEDRRLRATEKEDLMVKRLVKALSEIGRFNRMEDGTPIFFRHSDRRLYEVRGRPEGEFGQLVTWLTDLSTTTAIMKRSLDRLHAQVAEEAERVKVHALAYNGPDLDVVAINDFGGGLWYRKRGGAWEWKPNGSEGILFWSPSAFVEPWRPDFTTNPAIQDEDHLTWFLEQPHFADDVLTVRDQRMILRALLLIPFFPLLCRNRPVPAHLGLNQQRQHDTGKTTAGKMIGHLLAGPGFEPTPINPSPERGEEALQLALMHQPYVLLDNVDTEIKWLNDFLCTYATGARPTKRRLYTDTEQVHVEYRGRLTITSRKPKFNRPDTSSRVIPFRFKPISHTERKTEPELLDPVIERRGRIWAGLLSTVARIQDALPSLSPPSPSLRLADFEKFGWCVAAIYGEENEWQATMVRLEAAQAGFALGDEPLFVILKGLLKAGDLPEQPTSEFYEQVCKTAWEIGLDAEVPLSAGACTQQINELRDQVESLLDVKIVTRTLHAGS